jgi:predicted NUDIX family NTP pyrophosphohydrolase
MPKIMPKKSAGILLFRRAIDTVEVLLVHPGGPYWRGKDAHAWSIPKGEFDTEDPLQAAKREFAEETGGQVEGLPIPLSPVKQAGGKTVHAFAVEQDFDPATLRSNTFSLAWPPKSGRIREFPEVDQAAWFTPEIARSKLVAGQLALLDELLRTLAGFHVPHQHT